MMGRNTDQWTSMVSYKIRPALAEARLMNKKRARDVVYVATLTEELRDIEAEIEAVEQELQLSTSAFNNDEAHVAPAGLPDVDWIHTKSGELEARLHRIQQLSIATQPSRRAKASKM
jgi:hypothetical protein